MLKQLIVYVEGTESFQTTEIYLISVRYRKLEREKQRGEIDVKDYKLEFNSITYSLLEIMDMLTDIEPQYFNNISTKERVKAEIGELAKEFFEAQGIRSQSSRVRTMIMTTTSEGDPILIKNIGRVLVMVDFLTGEGPTQHL